MQQLIKIEKQIVGAVEVNAVDARELYMALEIKKDFSHWIKTQIERAGLCENVDYVTSTAVTGGRPQNNYILTADSSKHIAMMSQGSKAHAVRDYFIEVEKLQRTYAPYPIPQDINEGHLIVHHKAYDIMKGSFDAIAKQLESINSKLEFDKSIKSLNGEHILTITDGGDSVVHQVRITPAMSELIQMMHRYSSHTMNEQMYKNYRGSKRLVRGIS